MATLNRRVLAGLENYEGGYRLPPLRLAADDLREIVEQTKKYTRRDVYVLDADGDACDLDALDRLSNHKLSEVAIHTRNRPVDVADDQSIGLSVYLKRNGESHVQPEEPDTRGAYAATEVTFHIIRLSKARQDVRTFFWLLFALYAWALTVLPGWYVATHGADPRLFVAGALVVAASIYTGLIATNQLGHRMFIRRSGTVIEPGSRAEDRRRWRDTKHNLKIAIPTSAVSLVAGSLLTWWLG